MTIRRTCNVVYAYKQTQNLYYNMQGSFSLPMLKNILGNHHNHSNPLYESYNSQIKLVNVFESLQACNRYNRINYRRLCLDDIDKMLFFDNFDTKLIGCHKAALTLVSSEMEKIHDYLIRMDEIQDL